MYNQRSRAVEKARKKEVFPTQPFDLRSYEKRSKKGFLSVPEEEMASLAQAIRQAMD
jgi:hypothetical protein